MGMSLSMVFGSGGTGLVLILEPCTIGMDKQGPVFTVTVHSVPRLTSLMVTVELGMEVRPFKGVLLLHQGSGFAIGNLHRLYL